MSAVDVLAQCERRVARSAAEVDRRFAQIGESWQGDARDAAFERIRADLVSAESLSRRVGALRDAVDSGERLVEQARLDFFAAGAYNEAERVQALQKADEAAARLIDAASARLTDRGSRQFLPLAIGLAWAVEAAVNALIAAGVLSAGAMAFALVDRFGEGAWETIHDALPSTFFQDAGPVDFDGAREAVEDLTEPGRSSKHRQVESEDEVRTVFGELTDEARQVPTGNNPKVVERYELPDGTQIQLRNESKSGGLTIDIRHPETGRLTKVHVR